MLDSADQLSIEDYPKARILLEEVIKNTLRLGWWRKQADAYNVGFKCTAWNSDFAGAEYFLNLLDTTIAGHVSDITATDTLLLLAKLNKGIFLSETGDLCRAVILFRGLADILESANDKTDTHFCLLYQAYAFLASVLKRSGDFEGAAFADWKALQYRPYLHSQSPDIMTYAYLAETYLKTGNRTKAAVCYRKSLESLQKAITDKPGDPKLTNTLISTYQSVASFHLGGQHPDSAFFFLTEAGKRIKPNTNWSCAQDALLAQAWQKRGDSHKSLVLLNNSLRTARRLWGDYHYKTALVWKKLGDWEMSQNHFEKALAYYQKALVCLSPGLDVKGLAVLPSLDNVYAKRPLLEVLDAKSAAWWGWAQQQPKRLQYAEFALSTAELAIVLTDSIRLGFSTATDKNRLTELAYPLFERAIAATLHLSRADPLRTDYYLGKAWYLTEKNKALTLQENLRLSNALEANLTNDERIRRSKLLNDIANLERKIYEAETQPIAGGETALNDLKSRLSDRRRDYNRLMAVLQASQPEWFQNLYASAVADWQQVVAALPSKAVLIEYFIGNRTIFIFTVSHENGLAITQIQHDSALSRQITTLRKAMTDEKMRLRDDYAQRFRDAAKGLYDLLLRPSLQAMSPAVCELVIVPDGTLGNIPFEILLTGDGGSGFGDFPYLLRQYNVRYATSANMLKANSRANHGRLPWAGFAPRYNAGRDTSTSGVLYAMRTRLARSGEYDLPGARQEAKIISWLTGGRAFLDEEASETVFKAIANKYAVLHLSMHGRMDTTNALFSQLLFSHNTPLSPGAIWKETDDNSLYVNEIYAMRLYADLVVLSACDSGNGVLLRGEGAQSLGRAFAYAGVPATVQSLWLADDETTRVIMEQFYRNLISGMTKSEALRQAKLHWLAQTNADPALWANFIVYGDDAPVHFSPVAPLWMLVCLLICSLGLLLAIFLHK